MSYHNWISGIYSTEDGIFHHWESQDEINWLHDIIRNLGRQDLLFDENGNSKFIPKDEYEGFKRSHLTTNKRVKNETT